MAALRPAATAARRCRTQLADPVGYEYGAANFDALLEAGQRRAAVWPPPGALPPSAPAALILAHDDHLLSTPVNTCVGGVRNKLLFDSYDEWRGLGDSVVPVATDLRTRVIAALGDAAVVHEEYYEKEHSVEALIPFLSKSSPSAAILPVGVHVCDDPEGSGRRLAAALKGPLGEHKLSLGTEVQFILSNDSGHYGPQFQFEPFGSDEAGYEKQSQVDRAISSECLVGEVTHEKVRDFYRRLNFTKERVESQSLWCGMGPVSVGLHTLLNLQPSGARLEGRVLAQSDSVATAPLEAPPGSKVALTCPQPSYKHWVGHLAAAFWSDSPAAAKRPREEDDASPAK